MGSNNARLSPRQKMINLMYIVLTAMLALNVSSDVLDGFTQVEEGLARTNVTLQQRNNAIIGELEAFTMANPEKGKPWLQKALEVRSVTNDIYATIDSLKLEIVKAADGPKGDVHNIQSRDDLEAASVVMLNPTNPRGEKLRKAIDNYREYISSIMNDTIKRRHILTALSTEPVKAKGTVVAQSWEESKFSGQPVVAAVTLLTKLQNDVRIAEGSALQELLGNVDSGDVRVNQLDAFVVPNSRIVMRGGKYSANIVLAAIDTTQRPEIFVNGTKLGNDRGLYEITTGSTGKFDYKGYLQVPHGDGTFTRHEFASSYTVIEPSATVSATMMNVLYAGIDNPISISAPGIPMADISATMTNGTLTRNGDTWVARPSQVGADAVITVTATVDGSSQTVNTTTFRVRKLPDPTPYIAYQGTSGVEHYRGGKPFSKAALLSAGGVDAAIDDGILNIKFKVLSFETVFFDSMGNAMPEVSAGDKFAPRQIEQIKRLSRGKRFFITRIKATGPDGITRDLSPIEVIVN